VKKKLLVSVTLLTLLTGCGGPEKGTVLDRRYTAPETELEKKCVTKNANGTCKTYTYVTESDPEVCELYLDDNGNKGWLTVPCSLYGEYPKGSHYNG
jgi:hypothetical protein